MTQILDTSQRWWETTRPAAFTAGEELHISDSPKKEDWALMYRWAATKKVQAVALFSAAAVPLIAAVISLPQTTVPWPEVLRPAAIVLAILSVGVTYLIHKRASRKPFSIITLEVPAASVVVEQLEELWPQLSAEGSESLRVAIIKTFESRPSWSPQALQQAVVTQIERARTQALALE